MLDVTSQINLRAFRALRILMDASFDIDDDLIGVRLNLIFNLPNNWMDLLGITDQQFNASINVGEALQSVVSNRGQYVQNQIKNSQGKIDFVMSIRGIGFGLPSGGSTEPITTIFNMYDQNDVLKASYQLNFQALADCSGNSVPHPNFIHKSNTSCP